MKPIRNTTRMDMLKVVLLLTDGLSVEKVALRLNFSKDKVYRLIRLAKRKEHELLEETHLFQLSHQAKVSENELAQAQSGLDREANKLESELRDRIGNANWTLEEVHVIDAGKPGRTVEARFDYRKTFCALTGRILRRLLERSSVIAVAWGRLMRAMVDEQRRLGRLSLKTEANLIVLPVRGDLAGLAETTMFSPGRIALDLAEALTGSVTAGRSLAGVPPFLPRIDTINDPFQSGRRIAIEPELAASILKEYVLGSQSFREVFGPATGNTRPLIDRADTVLTSVGTHDEFSIGPWNAQVLDASVKTNSERVRLREELERLAIGDIAGVLIPRNANDRMIDVWRDTWVGLTERHLSECARRVSLTTRRNDRKPGVVVLAVSDNGIDAKCKAEVLVRCIDRQLITRLLVDRQIAGELVKELRETD